MDIQEWTGGIHWTTTECSLTDMTQSEVTKLAEDCKEWRSHIYCQCAVRAWGFKARPYHSDIVVDILFVVSVDAEMVEASLSVVSSPSETVPRDDILCNTRLYVVHRLPFHAARACSMHQHIQVTQSVQVTLSIQVTLLIQVTLSIQQLPLAWHCGVNGQFVQQWCLYSMLYADRDVWTVLFTLHSSMINYSKVKAICV